MSKTKGEKLVITDQTFKKHKVAKEVDVCPHQEYSTTTIVKPQIVEDLNKDEVIKFEIKAGRDEYISFPDIYNLVAEITTVKKVETTAATETAEARYTTTCLDLETDGICWPVSSSLLSLFDDISITWQNKYFDKCNSLPLPATFWNNIAAQDLIFSSKKYQKEHKLLGNIPPWNKTFDWNNYSKTQNPELYNIYSKHHHIAENNALNVDAPSGVPELKETGRAHGKFHYCKLPIFPFTSVTPYIQNRYGINQNVLLPPFTHLTLYLRKTKIEPFHLFDNKLISSLVNFENTNPTRMAALNTKKIKKITPFINSMYMMVNRHKLIQKASLNELYFKTNFTYSNIEIQKLNTSTLQEIELQWAGNKIPEYAVVWFLRENDISFNITRNLTVGGNRFWLPQYLKEIKVMYNDTQMKVYDGIDLKELNSKTRDPSKILYYNYLINQQFISPDIPIYDYFNQYAEDNGFLNIFPISIKGREMSNSLISRGFKLLLKYNESNTTSWYIAVRYVFQGIVDIKNNNENVIVNFDT